MRIKNGVRFHSGPMAMCHASMVIESVYRAFGVEWVVTGGIEDHEPPSKHPTGEGLDYRTREFHSQSDKAAFANDVRNRLGDGFDVVLESDHLHVEYDPKN